MSDIYRSSLRLSLKACRAILTVSLRRDLSRVVQEACSALAEVLPRDVATSLVHLWHAATAGNSQLSAFCEILEEQVRARH